jgi:hypothetical protein
MPILINELELEIEPAGVLDSGQGGDAEVTPLTADEMEVVCLLDLIDERRARLTVD